MRKVYQFALLPVAAALLTACATPHDTKYKVQQSKIAGGDLYKADENKEPDALSVANSVVPAKARFTELPGLSRGTQTGLSLTDLLQDFADNDEQQLSVDAMPVEEFVHTVLGELLGTSYVIADGTPNLTKPVTLNLQKSVSSRQLFRLTNELLSSHNIAISKKDDVLFVHGKSPAEKANLTVSFGRSARDVPDFSGTIIHMVRFRYALTTGFEQTIRNMTDAAISTDQDQNAIYINGTREQIIRVLELVRMLDVPAARGQHVALLRLTYVPAADFSKKLTSLMQAEGMPIDVDRVGRNNLALVTLEQIGAIAMFAAEPGYIERARFWAEQIDQPAMTAEKSYFVFHPTFARASDLGESLSNILGGNFSPRSNRSRDTQSSMNGQQNSQYSGYQPGYGQNQNQGMNQNQGFSPNNLTGVYPGQNSGNSRSGLTGQLSNLDMSMSVDERSNSLVFHTTGKNYQSILTMVKMLDVMPKQILLEATIAEVTLSGAFSMGVEFAINNGAFKAGTLGAFGTDKIGGLNIATVQNLDSFLLNLNASDGQVNVLSNPSLVVRDGVTASINVGTDIPTVGSTTTDPLNTSTKQTTTVVYRKTGVQLSVTPTINAQGLVMMEIDQAISNSLEGSSASSGSPSIFERQLRTEIIAQSGQTVLLGGLISENNTENESKVPVLGDLPLIGNLFKSQKKTKSKTELIILITPRVVDRPEHWIDIKQKLNEAFRNVSFE